ncbi:MAG: zinc-dependent dehydrogenase [Euryarchaeota archaeon]|nr:zinc-dependent dehydrogenase [Euryarchaeota archaeon]
MKVAMYYTNKDIRVKEVPKPVPGDGELIAKVMASGICGSDLMEWYRVKKAPRVLGHETAGEIVETGRGVKKFKIGDRIMVTHHVSCGTCIYCKTGRETCCKTLRSTNFYPGGFSEFLRVPKINVQRGTLKLPNNVSYEEGTFIEPLGCVLRAQRLTNIGVGDTVVVIGSGISGILHIQLARARGARKIIATDIAPYRRKMAKKFGADRIINAKENVPERIKEYNNGRLADKVIVATGAVPAVKQALKSVDMGGTILFFAPTNPGVEIPVELLDLWSKCVKIVTSYAAVKKDLEEALKLIRKRKINVKDMITHRLPLSETQKGFALMAEGKDSLKIIIKPHE